MRWRLGTCLPKDLLGDVYIRNVGNERRVNGRTSASDGHLWVDSTYSLRLDQYEWLDEDDDKCECCEKLQAMEEVLKRK